MPFVVRYILNFVLQDKWKTFSKNEIIFTYSHHLMESIPNPNYNNILFMNVANIEVFNNKNNLNIRKGTCFYASKYKKRGGVLNDEINNKTSFEITRYGKNSPSQKEIAEVFRRSEIFYSYEDTTLAIEAILCGCPVVFIPNTIFPDLHLAREEVGIHGYALNTSNEEIEIAKATVSLTPIHMSHIEETFKVSLEHFIKVTQANNLKLQENYNILKKHLTILKIKFILKSIIEHFT